MNYVILFCGAVTLIALGFSSSGINPMVTGGLVLMWIGLSVVRGK